MNNLFSKLIKKNSSKDLEKIILDLKKTFPEFYFEIQRHNDLVKKI